MFCQFVSKRGVRCHDKVLSGSSWCHRKRHYPDNRTYRGVVESLKAQWKKTTFSTALFDMYLVPEDGWCFFYSFGYSLLRMMKRMLSKYPLEERARRWRESTDPILVFFRRDRFRQFFEGKMEEVMFRKEMARALQTLGSEWILRNLNTKHEQTGELVQDLLLSSHELDSVDEYKEEIKNLPSIDDKNVLSQSNWGSVCEQYALAKHFKVNVMILSPVTFSLQGKVFRSRIAKVVRRNVTRLSPMSHCIPDGHTSELGNFLQMAEDSDDSMAVSLFWETLPDSLKAKTQNELMRTAYLVWFSDIDEDGDDVSHYNYLVLNPELLPKK